jgi:hypothetical protein
MPDDYTRLRKAPGDDMPYDWDFTAEPVFAADPITSAAATDWAGAALSGVTVGVPAIGAGDDVGLVQTVISGGTDGQKYRIKLRATNAAGRDREAFLYLIVEVPTVPS